MASLDDGVNGVPVGNGEQPDAEKTEAVTKQAEGNAAPTENYVAPEGVVLNDIGLRGTTMVVTLPDESEILVENAQAVFDQLLVDGVLFPFSALQDLDDIGAPSQSSGGDFIVDPGEISPGLPITPLLPPTELAFGFPVQDEIFLLEDDPEPEVVRVTSTLVDEDGFRYANVDTPTSLETDGDENLTDSGLITINYFTDVPADLDAALVLDDLGSYDSQLTSDGQQVVFALDGGDLVGTIDGGATEVLRISIQNGPSDDGNGVFTYTYEVTLSQPVDQPLNDNEDILSLVGVQFTATDSNGDSVSGSFDAGILDDVPSAFDDDFTQGGEYDDEYDEYQEIEQDILPPGEGDPVSGNVLDDNGNGEDEFGADGPGSPIVAYVNGSLSGTGNLVLNADGSFTYTPGAGEEGTVTFQYDLRDGDDDKSRATVTIELLPDSVPTIRPETGEVDEAALDDGSNSTSTAEMTTGTFTIDTGNDGVGSLVIDGVDVTNGGTVTGDYGTLVVTEAGGDYSWVYTLDDNTDDHPNTATTGTNEGVQDDFDIKLTDGDDGDMATTQLVIDVLDDGPDAKDDAFTQSAENADVDGNVLDDNGSGEDVEGADNPGTVSLVNGSLTGSGSLTLNGDGSFTYEPGAGETGSVTFDYELTDTDGDVSTATVTIDLLRDSEPTAKAGDVTVDEDGFAFANDDLPTGEETDSTESLTGTGAIFVSYGNDTPADIDANFTLVDTGALDGQLVTLAGDDVEFALEGGDLVGRSAGDNSVVITIAITDSTDNGSGNVDYEYTVTLAQPVQHPVNDNEDSVVLSGVTFMATDGDDGDQFTGTFSVAVVDDVLTTGATLSACAEACYTAGAKDVNVLVFARVATDR